MSNCDPTADVSRQRVFTYSKLYEFPEYVKQASEAATLSPQELPASAYADPGLKQFPCHTKAACYLSTVFFLENRDAIPTKKADWLAKSLAHHATRYGIRDDIAALRDRHVELHKQSDSHLPDSSFAIVLPGADGRKDRRYPMTNATEVKAASAWFAEYRDHFEFSDRQAFAQKILEKAGSFGAQIDNDVDDMLQKQAGYGIYDPTAAADMLRKRAALKRIPPAVRDGLLKLAEDVESNPMLSEDPTSTAKLAATVDQFDRHVAHLSDYSESYPRPEDVLFAGSLKTARQYIKEACATLSGAVYSQQQFEKLSLSMVRDNFGDAVAEEVENGLFIDGEKFADIAATFPLPDAQRLDELMSGAGEGPIRKAASEIGVSQIERRKLAEQYKLVNALPQVTEVGEPTGVSGSRVIGGAV